MPRNPYEKDTIDGLRDLRGQMADLIKTIVVFAEAIDKRFDELEKEMMDYRKERLQEEIESHELALKKKSNALSHAENGNTQKMKTIASEQVKAELETKKIDYAKIWREKVVPALLTTFATVLMLALLAAVIPGFAEVLLRAFGR